MNMFVCYLNHILFHFILFSNLGSVMTQTCYTTLILYLTMLHYTLRYLLRGLFYNTIEKNKRVFEVLLLTNMRN